MAGMRFQGTKLVSWGHIEPLSVAVQNLERVRLGAHARPRTQKPSCPEGSPEGDRYSPEGVQGALEGVQGALEGVLFIALACLECFPKERGDSPLFASLAPKP